MKTPNLKKIAVDILALREHGRYELKQKLKKHTQDDLLLEETLEFLEQNNYLSEERFVEAFIRSKANRGYGPHWIQQALMNKKIDKTLMMKYLYHDIDWLECTKAVYLKKYKNNPPIDYAELAKRQRYLKGRGFLSEHIAEVL